MAAALPAGPAPRTTASASIGDPSNARAESGVAVDLSEVATGFYNHAKLREVIDHVLMASRIIFCTHEDATSPGIVGLKPRRLRS